MVCDAAVVSFAVGGFLADHTARNIVGLTSCSLSYLHPLVILKVVTSRVWRHRVTWRHRWPHHSI